MGVDTDFFRSDLISERISGLGFHIRRKIFRGSDDARTIFPGGGDRVLSGFSQKIPRCRVLYANSKYCEAKAGAKCVISQILSEICCEWSL